VAEPFLNDTRASFEMERPVGTRVPLNVADPTDDALFSKRAELTDAADAALGPSVAQHSRSSGMASHDNGPLRTVVGHAPAEHSLRTWETSQVGIEQRSDRSRVVGSDNGDGGHWRPPASDQQVEVSLRAKFCHHVLVSGWPTRITMSGPHSAYCVGIVISRPVRRPR